MPNQLDQPSPAPSERIKRAAERVLGQMLLHQHGKPDHALAHVRHAAGQVDAHARRQGDHRRSKAASTRPSTAASTVASTRNITPLVSTISIRPYGRDTGSGTGVRVDDIGSGSAL